MIFLNGSMRESPKCCPIKSQHVQYETKVCTFVRMQAIFVIGQYGNRMFCNMMFWYNH